MDRLEHPDYYHIVDTPMDLRTIKEDLLGGNYDTPTEFAKDMKMIFTNSRNYNTNKRSRVSIDIYFSDLRSWWIVRQYFFLQIYTMTIRLSAMFEEHMRRIISTWKSARRRTENAKAKAKAKSQGRSVKARLTNGAGKFRNNSLS